MFELLPVEGRDSLCQQYLLGIIWDCVSTSIQHGTCHLVSSLTLASKSYADFMSHVL